MALSDDIILSSGQILVTQTAPVKFASEDNKMTFAIVQLVSDVSNGFAVNDMVMFETVKAKKLIYGSTMYYLLDEENVSGREVLPP